MMQPPFSPNCFAARLEVSSKVEHIRVELAMKLFVVYVVQGQPDEDTGIVDKDVHLAECFSVSLKNRSISSDEVTLPCTAMAFPPATLIFSTT